MKKKTKSQKKEYLAQIYRRNCLPFALSVAAALLISAVNLIIAWVLQQIIDTISGAGSYSLGTLTLFSIGVVGLICLFKTLTLLTRPRFIRRAMEQYKAYAFEKLLKKSIASFSLEPTSRYLSAFSNDLASIETNYLDNLFEIILNVVLFLGALGMMLWYSPLLLLVACGFCLLPLGASFLAGKRLERLERTISEKNEAFLAVLKDCLSGFSVIKSFQAEDAMGRQFTKASTDVEAEKCRKRKLTSLISIVSDMAGVTAQLGTFLAGGAMMFAGLPVTVGTLVIFLDLTSYIIMPIRELPALLAARRAALGLVDKLASEMAHNVREEGGATLETVRQGISLSHLTFGYAPEQPVLHDVTATFEAGKSYAIVGASGSGKSTLLRLLLASYENYDGDISIDGRELRTLKSGCLYDLVAAVEQNVFLFDATIRENITMYRPFPKEAVDKAIAQAGLTALLEQRGEDYRCGEHGSGLSGGEKQRISIARSLLRHASVLLADEATASLDAETANHVSESILGLTGMTRIVVTHTLDESLLRRYDGILVMKDGRIAESGTFDDLMAARQYLYALYTISH